MFPHHVVDLLDLSSDLIFTVTTVIFCFLIYLKTRESYELTKYKGIKYFRDAFLFFGISYVLRFLFSLTLLSRVTNELLLPKGLVMLLSIILLGYFSTMGIVYLIFSFIWKKFDNKKLEIFGHGIAIALSIVALFTASHLMLISLQIILLGIALILGFTTKLKVGKMSPTKGLYFLIIALWFINLIITSERLFTWETEVFFQITSIVVFAIIYHKISKLI
ncbi:Uncharacterised protein [uncultured archaeon]|nr:Uncharacterised protein [uncultured archaeon]